MIGKTMADIYDYCCTHYAHKTAVVFGNQKYTFADLKEKGDRLARSFIGLGLKRGDIIAILLPNSPEVLFVDYACSRLGIGAIPLANYLQIKDIKFMVQESGACALLFDHKFRDAVQAVKSEFADHIRNCICSAPSPDLIQAGEHHLQDLIERTPAGEVVAAAQLDDVAMIIYTGGTTGTPKGVVHTQRTWVNTLVLEMLELGIGRDEVFLAATPLTHGARAYLYPTWLKGGSGVILQGFQLPQFFETIQNERVTSTFMVPTMIYAVLNYPDLKRYDLSSLRNIIYGAAPISPERLREAVRVFGPIFTQSYGQVECPTVISVLSKEELSTEVDERSLSRFASCGRPSLGMLHRLVDSHGNDVQKGQPGEIVVKSPNMMIEYLNRPDLTSETIKDGWLHTGDIARQDDEGYLFMVDRKKDMIVSGGFNIFPKEIEDTLSEHEAVSMAAVIGVPDEKWGESATALIVKKSGREVTEGELINFCKERKGSTICPKSIVFVETIPTTALGKPDKKQIRAQYWKGRERNI